MIHKANLQIHKVSVNSTSVDGTRHVALLNKPHQVKHLQRSQTLQLDAMHRPVLYHQHNAIQKSIAEKVISKYAKWMQWRNDGLDSLIDVGTGTGNVLMEIVKPHISKAYRRVVGIDMASDAIAFAKTYYKSQRKVEFKILDIGTENELPADLIGQFDHVTSFNCLHWINNQIQALKNIYQLIRPEGGDFLLCFQPYLPFFDIYEVLQNTSTWSPYIGHIDYFGGPLQRIEEDELSNLLEEIGFDNVEIEYSFGVHTYQSEKEFKEHMAASCMFLKHIPPQLHSTIMKDFVDIAQRLGCRASSPSGNKCKYSLNFTNAVVYAKKLPQCH
ncbi:juvenile hormone acid O-methyltransferase [Stomoxys calcitrans]|uniref:juvenile hormone acid O-methyltransferase n=1 Tax=Stomoxys calcitrans TaxID=35570 RepID=UPI0027E23D1D|nr:juvenile hormone acid O-methyltransferase [Stomoxys calcitrans]XP_013113386.2 juvenile hormone acid O-methyltransferase [Stomoxys calcitrans]